MKRRFDFVVFWDEVAWVAATTGPYLVAQGDSRDDAIRNLRMTLSINVAVAKREGHQAWAWLREDGSDRMVPPAEFHERAKSAPFVCEGSAGDKATNYRGTVWVDDAEEENR